MSTSPRHHQEARTDELELMPTNATTLDVRQRSHTWGGTHNRQCRVGDVRLLATVSCPDVCDCFAQPAADVNVFRVTVVDRIGDRLRAIKFRQSVAALKCRGALDIKDTCLTGWPGAAYGLCTKGGGPRFGYLISPSLPSLEETCRVIYWLFRFARRTVETKKEGRIYAFKEPVCWPNLASRSAGEGGGVGELRESSLALHWHTRVCGAPQDDSLALPWRKSSLALDGGRGMAPPGGMGLGGGGGIFKRWPDNLADGPTKHKPVASPLLTIVYCGPYRANNPRPLRRGSRNCLSRDLHAKR